MAHLGDVFKKDDKYFPKTDSKEAGVRFYMEGPLRTNHEGALLDLHYIRSAAVGAAARTAGLHSMKFGCQRNSRGGKNWRDWSFRKG